MTSKKTLDETLLWMKKYEQSLLVQKELVNALRALNLRWGIRTMAISLLALVVGFIIGGLQ